MMYDAKAEVIRCAPLKKQAWAITDVARNRLLDAGLKSGGQLSPRWVGTFEFIFALETAAESRYVFDARRCAQLVGTAAGHLFRALELEARAS